jgi:hypothetical protein
MREGRMNERKMGRRDGKIKRTKKIQKEEE